MKLRNLLITGLLVFCVSSLLSAQEGSLYKVVYEADREGNRISGSLEELNDYVRNGNPIRVGWELGKRDSTGRARLEHWTDAGFITILKGHVFAQITSIYGQGSSHPSIEVPFVQMMNGEPDGWVAIIGTTGEMRQKFKTDQATLDAYREMGLNDEQIAEQLKAQEKMKVRTMWAVMIKE
ncbi:hypothetical protein BFP97_10575 [Roseivirga sp. 4D4]|uniref:hypothetical protein n=1 Tax=Roseivirga sp. 4D4 TaxID=1889784 RepID=UPI0008534651|nr:hypothetical protein [Roseivirga sp. 4D4]OEK01933.1 hypothetical protein BFP97_10575 [Roseivirga sp. 4D4]